MGLLRRFAVPVSSPAKRGSFRAAPAHSFGLRRILKEANRFLAPQIDFYEVEFFPEALKIEMRPLKSI